MPLVLLNFPHIDLKGYVVEYRLTDGKQGIISFRYQDADVFTARARAIIKAMELREQIRQAGIWSPKNYGRIRLCLPYRQSRPEQGISRNGRIYLLDGTFDPSNQMKMLDLETAHLLGADKAFPQREIDFGLLKYVMVDQCLKELLNFYR